MKNKGVSPVIATVLLIAMVVVLSMIIFIWFNSFMQEAITKNDENVELVCDKVDFSASYSGGDLYISNNGNVPIFSMKVRVYDGGDYETEDISDFVSTWPGNGLNPGAVFSESVSSEGKIILIPVLLGNSDEGKRSYVCDDKYGKEI